MQGKRFRRLTVVSKLVEVWEKLRLRPYQPDRRAQTSSLAGF